MKIDLPIGDLEKMVEFQNFLREKSGEEVEAITPDVMEQLIKTAEESERFANSFGGQPFNLLQYEYHGFACGCMGPQDGFTMCGCMLSSMLSRHRFEVALEIKRRQSL